MNTIACVLKTGVFKPWRDREYTTEYGPHHVQWLRDQFARCMTVPYRFVCLSDIEIPGVEVIPLQDSLPGWWSKIELFREFSENTSYVDLDTCAYGDIAPILFSGKKFLISAHMTQRHGVNSSVMSWNQDMRFIYDKFIADKERYMAEYVFARRWGDQDFIKETWIEQRGPIDKFQHHHPGFVVSYKYDIRDRGLPIRPGGKRRLRLRPGWYNEPHIVAFHGSPKPAEVQHLHHWIPPLCAA